MRNRKVKVAAACLAVGALAAAIGVPLAWASWAESDGNGLAMTVSLNLRSDSKAQFTTHLSRSRDVNLVVSCAKSSTHFMIATMPPAQGLGAFALSDPVFTSCNDNLGGTDKVRSTGLWTLSFTDSANDEGGEVDRDMLNIGVPVAGVTITSSAVPNCTVTIRPNEGRLLFTGSYDDKGTLTWASVSHFTFSDSGGGCPAPVTDEGSFDVVSSTKGANGAYKITPAIKDVS